MTKVCTVCSTNLPLSHFHNSSVYKDGKAYRCKSCDREARKKYIENNQDTFALVARRKQLKFKYGLTLDQYQDLLNSQNNKCAICECLVNSKKVKTSFAVDHNHTTGKIRGLLCNQCNRALGMFDDSVDTLRRALNYLERETH